MTQPKPLKKLLFIQHATEFGGSAMSLLYTLQGIQKENNSYQIIVALAKWTETLASFYESFGFEVVKPNFIDTYEHTQLVSYNVLHPIGLYNEIKQLLKIKKARKNTRLLIESIKPNLVHLNSVVLFPSALELSAMEIPFVWHVREPSIKGLFGIRKRKIQNALKSLPNKTIYICNSDKTSWGNPANGIVVYNFIDFDKFNLSIQLTLDVNIDTSGDTINILFLGGVNKVKGAHIMLKAFDIILKENSEKKINLIFAGGKYSKPNYFIYKIASTILPLLGLCTYTQYLEREIKRLKLEIYIIRLPFIKDIAQIFKVCHLLVFPSIRPHFARPIIEAGAMCLPVVGSNLGGVDELINNGENGFLCPPNNYKCFANKVNYLINNPLQMKNIGFNGNKIAFEKYNQQINILKILDVYKNILN
jgi:glycosyltransferase involved in cell wall biosynthesis